MSHSNIQMDFEKFHGASNDFIFMHGTYLSYFKTQEQIKNFVKLNCNRYQGVGSDGIIFYNYSLPSNSLKNQKIEILIVNSDGSFAGTCGNALRCLGLKLMRDKYWNGENELPIYRLLPSYLFDSKNFITNQEQFIFEKTPFAVLTKAKLNSLLKAKVSVAMAKEDEIKNTPLIENSLIHYGNELDFLTPIFVNLSNPHWVFISSNFKNFNKKMFEEFGLFAQGDLRLKSLIGSVPLANIGMITLNEKNSLLWNLVVFERGAGLTECCGSGAVAARLALEFAEYVSAEAKEIQFQMLGGLVSISNPQTINGMNGQRILTGPAKWVFNGWLIHHLDK